MSVVDTLRDWRVWWQVRRWPSCECGLEKVAPHTATEIGGWRHDEDECYKCDEYGNRRLW